MLKSKFIIALIISVWLPAAAGWAADAKSEKAATELLDAPLAVLPESRYEFEPVADGTRVVHDFVIKNKGKAVLKIEKVRTG